jgi:hypothetical protein
MMGAYPAPYIAAMSNGPLLSCRISAGHLGEKARPKVRMTGVTPSDGNGIKRYMHRDAIPGAWGTIEPEGSSCGCERAEAAKNLHDHEGLKFAMGCEDDAAGPSVVFEMADPPWGTDQDITGQDIERDLVANIETIRLSRQRC